ncbi:MAG: response regulator transcription factor [Lachnospiraceae bacterium]|nr:response regulator transcription factor [Lachnospiraceae bacterium]
MKLLLAEDTKDLNRALTAVLMHEGYDVDPVYDGAEALDHIRRDSFDAMILDIMMPKMSGIEVLTEIRKINIVTPVLLLTAKSEIDDRVAGLDAGADDYLTKPFAMKELLARVRAMTRRRTDYSGKDLRFNDLHLDAEKFELSSENSVRLSVKEFELMQTLILNADKEVDTKYILDHVWDKEPDARDDTVWLYISYLRGKLSSVDSKAKILGSRGGSYRLVAG